MKPLLLIGCGGHARSLIELVETVSDWRIYGLVGLPSEVGSNIFGYSVIGTDQDLPKFFNECSTALIAIGQLPDPTPRQLLAEKLYQLGFSFPTLISPYAIVSQYSRLGCGTTVGHGAIVNAGAVVGDHCILNSSSLVEHDVQVGDFCHVSTGVLINGGASVGSGSFIGSGTILREGVGIPPSTVIGAGKRVMGWPLRDS